MNIAMSNMYPKDNSDLVVWSDATAFVERWGVARLKHNIDHLWCWNIGGKYDGFESDGPCIFVDFGLEKEA